MKRVLIMIVAMFLAVGCIEEQAKGKPVSDSGVRKVSAKVQTGPKGMTVEQENVKRRVEEDNKPGAIKHLYLISAYSGQVIFYSTVDGKVTSSGKRLTSTVALKTGDKGQYTGHFVMPRIQDDGTYGSSIPYIFWWDTKGVYHQHYISGGQIVHVSDQPIAVKSVIINLESVDKSKE